MTATKTGEYGVNIFWSGEDACYVATFPDFPNLSAFGDTWEEALADARIVLGMALDYLTENGIAPPRPTLEQNARATRSSARSGFGRAASSAEAAP